MLTVTLPIKTVSESNSRGHWAKKAKRAKSQRGLAAVMLRNHRAAVPTNSFLPVGLVVTLTRIAPRSLDDDNLRGALKAVRDGVADWLGINDNDPRVSWQYGQERGQVRQYAVIVSVTARVTP